jgi:hypothetical protein
MQNLVAKTYTSLCKSCRGILGLQLCYSSPLAVQLRNLENHQVKQWYFETFWGWNARHARRRVTPHRVGSAALRTRTHVETPLRPPVRGRALWALCA